MTATFSLQLSNAPHAYGRLQLPAKAHLPQFHTVCAWGNSGSKHEPLSCRFSCRKISEATKYRASLDSSQVTEKVSSPPNQSPEEEANKKIEDSVEYIKNLLMTSGDGRVSVSPYDTSIVALIKDLKGRDGPQFPSCLEWIAEHQLADGSWGDEFFCIYDRIVNTLACLVALKSWNLHLDKIEKGVSFIKENVHKLKDGKAEHVTSGFEIVVPATLERAKALGIQGLPYDDPIIKEITNSQERRLKDLPKELIYESPTSLLFSLEGLENLEWERILKLQSADGSFLTSPSSTAFVFMHTKDEKCLRFIENAVRNCNGGAGFLFMMEP